MRARNKKIGILEKNKDLFDVSFAHCLQNSIFKLLILFFHVFKY